MNGGPKGKKNRNQRGGKQEREELAINDEIRAPEVRLVGDNVEEGIYPILKALKNCHGDMMTVKDEEILEAQKRLGKAGIYVELSAASALAAAERFFQAGKPDNYRVVIPLTATGLKR